MVSYLEVRLLSHHPTHLPTRGLKYTIWLFANSQLGQRRFQERPKFLLATLENELLKNSKGYPAQ